MAVVPMSGKRVFRPTDRFFKFAESITIYLDMETYAIAASQPMMANDVFPDANPYQKFIIPQPGLYRGNLRCKQFPVGIKHYIFGPFWASFHPVTITEYEFDFVDPPPVPTRELKSDKWGGLGEMFWNNLLVFFYEQHLRWIQQKFGQQSKDRDKWPEHFRFAWALRNAAVHHGGHLNLTDPNVPPIKWHHLQFDHTNGVGTRLFGDVLHLGDMLIFLIELSDEFDRLGCPQAP